MALVHNSSGLRSLCEHGETYSIVLLGGLPLLALAAEVRPRYRFEARLRNRLLTEHACAIRALFDPSERLFDRSEKTTISSVQLNLKLRFCIGIRLVNFERCLVNHYGFRRRNHVKDKFV